MGMRRLINDPTYSGMVKHGDQIYPGQHAAIIDRETWDLAQAKSKASRAPANHPTNALLSGLLFTRSGEPFYYRYTSKPTRRYGYDVSRSEARFGAGHAVERRIPAGWIEQEVGREICAQLTSHDFIAELSTLLKSTGHGVLPELSTPQLRAVFHDADALWQQLDAAEQRRLASALISRIDLGSVNPTSFQITWKAHSLSPQPMETSHAL
jgi:site-specific DNA recombinase